jgi:hypothetical protein
VTQFDDDLADCFDADEFPSKQLSYNGVTAPVWTNEWDQTAFDGPAGGVIAGAVQIECPTGQFPGIAIGAAVTLDGVNYTVRDRLRPIEMVDGAITYLLLVKS